MEEITAILVEEFRPPKCENFFIATFKHPDTGVTFAAVGNSEDGELKPQLSYRLYGKWAEHERFGKQFKVSTFTTAKPHGRAGVVKYLETHCDGIGRATAEQLWNLFNADAVRICREHPDVVASQVKRLSLEQCQKIADSLKDISALEDTSIELIDLLAGRGLPRGIAKEAVRRWGNKAPQIIQRDPYKLMVFRGAGFIKCDSMYVDLGLPPAKMKRQIYCAWYSIASDTEGHTWLPEIQAQNYLQAKIAGVQIDLQKAIGVAKRKGILWTRQTCNRCGGSGRAMVPDLFFGDELVDGPCPACGGGQRMQRWIADSRKAAAEDFVARHIVEAELETRPQLLPEFADDVELLKIVPTHTRCTRCHRKLTAPEVAILNDEPYGPDCIKRVAGGDSAEQISLEDWLARHPVIEERRTEKIIGQLEVRFQNQWPVVASLPGLTDHQRERLEQATLGRISILGGPPGVGKTYCAAALIKEIVRIHGPANVAACAPTGKAARRLTELLTGYGINLKARTIHSLLGVESSDDGGWTFKHKQSNPLPYKFVITDESSMIDCSLMASLLAARARGTHVLFIGDVNQLPPVGHGAPLRDLIAAGLPYGELTEIKRNAGTIVRACSQIRNGRSIFEIDQKIELEPVCPAGCCDGAVDYGAVCPTCDGTGKAPPKNLVLLHASKSQAASVLEQKIVELRDAGVDVVWDCQVIVAVNKRSPLARVTLNKRLQEILNPGGAGVQGSPFRVGDKIICLKNSFFRAADAATSIVAGEDGQVAVANGEFGEVLAVEAGKTKVKFFDPDRVVEVSRMKAAKAAEKAGEDGDGGGEEASGTGCDLDLGYAATAHKMQGSECPYVIIALDEYAGATGKFGICKREWLYTAISRAKTACYLVGMRGTAKTQVEQTALDRRKTFLRDLIEKYRKEFAARAAEKAQKPAETGDSADSTNLPGQPQDSTGELVVMQAMQELGV
jgi:DNA polymerase III delta prime subunit